MENHENIYTTMRIGPNPNTAKSVKLFGVTLTQSNTNIINGINDSACSADNLGNLRKSVSLGNFALMQNNVNPTTGGHGNLHNISSNLNHNSYNGNRSLNSQLSSNTRSATTAQSAGRNSDQNQGYVSDGPMQTSCSTSSRERKKGVPWTEDEHRLFLIGLQKLGKGDWRGISRNFVTTRTPTQVASHAQKYFLRQCNVNKRKRRPSLFDISSGNVQGNSQHSSSTTSTADFNLTAPAPELRLGHRTTALPPISPTDLFLGSWSNVQPQQQKHSDHLKRQYLCQDQSSQLSCNPVMAAEDDRNIAPLMPSKTFNIVNNHSCNISLLDQSLSTIKPMPSMASCNSSLSSSSSSSSLCRIDETAELSSLNLSIGPPPPMMNMEPSDQLSLKHDHLSSRHSVSMATNTSSALVNAISVG